APTRSLSLFLTQRPSDLKTSHPSLYIQRAVTCRFPSRTWRKSAARDSRSPTDHARETPERSAPPSPPQPDSPPVRLCPGPRAWSPSTSLLQPEPGRAMSSSSSSYDAPDLGVVN